MLKTCAISLLLAGCLNLQAQAGYSNDGSPVREVPLFHGNAMLGESTSEVKKGLAAQSRRVSGGSTHHIASLEAPSVNAIDVEETDYRMIPVSEEEIEEAVQSAPAPKTEAEPAQAQAPVAPAVKAEPVKEVVKEAVKPAPKPAAKTAPAKTATTAKPAVKSATAGKKPTLLENPIYLQMEGIPAAEDKEVGTLMDIHSELPDVDGLPEITIEEIKQEAVKPEAAKATKPAPAVQKATTPAAKKPAKVAAAASAPAEANQYLMTEEEEEERLTMKLQSLATASIQAKKKAPARDNRVAMLSSRKPTRGFATLSASTALLTIPIKGSYISSRFGQRWGRHHDGTDFAAPMGTSIYASAAGTIVNSGWAGGYGNMILIDHGNGLKTLYGHCSKINVSNGQWVERGDVIGKVGNTGHSTGPHLHYEILSNGVRVNPEPILFR